MSLFRKERESLEVLLTTLWPRVQQVKAVLKGEDSAARETICYHVLLEILVHPARSATAEEGEVGVIDGDNPTFPRSLLEYVLIPDGREETNDSLIQMLTA